MKNKFTIAIIALLTLLVIGAMIQTYFLVKMQEKNVNVIHNHYYEVKDFK